MLTTSCGLAWHKNFLALPILVVGLWKFGFPETLLYQYSALYSGANDNKDNDSKRTNNKKTNSRSIIGRMSDFLNGTGTASHHTAVCLSISMALVGVARADRHTLNLVFLLIVQHWFVVMKYVNKTFYVVVELALEALFEWVFFSEFQYLVSNHWTVVLAGVLMVSAHWEYLLAASLDMVDSVVNKSEIDDNVETQ